MRTPLLLLVVLCLSACGLLDDPTADEARVFIVGTASSPVQVTVSSKFVAGVTESGETRVVVFEADSVVQPVPFDQTYDIRGDNRFFMEAEWSGTDVDSIRIQVFIDGRLVFDEGGALLEGVPYRFVYTLNQQITDIVEVVF